MLSASSRVELEVEVVAGVGTPVSVDVTVETLEPETEEVAGKRIPVLEAGVEIAEGGEELNLCVTGISCSYSLARIPPLHYAS